MNRWITRSLSFAHSILFPVLVLVSLHSPRAMAQIATGTVSAAMGGAGRAAVDAGENSWLNPATLTQARGYFLGIHGSVEKHQVEGNQKQYGLVAADNEEGQLMAGSLSYIHNNVDVSTGNIYAQDLQIAIAGQFVYGISLGASIHRLALQVSDGSNPAQYDGTLGALWSPISTLGVALVAYDLVPQDKAIQDGLRLIPTIAGGVNWVIQDILQTRLDFSHPLSGANGRTDIMAGIGSAFHPNFAFRVGADFKETQNQTWITAGLGFMGPKLSVDYTFQKDVRQAQGYRHLVDLWMPF